MTDKQIEAAAEAMRNVWPNFSPSTVISLARAAYPHLAVWEEPTESEIIDIQDMWLPDLSGIPRTIIACILISFVRSRNADLLLKPADPRIELRGDQIWELVSDDENGNAWRPVLNLWPVSCQWIATAIPKPQTNPVDPRREEIVAILDRVSRHTLAPSNALSEILAALIAK